MLVMVSHVVLSLVIIDFTQHLAGKLILWNKSVISTQIDAVETQ